MRAAVHDQDRFDDDDEPTPPATRPPACVLQWHLCEEEPIPDEGEILAYDNDGRPRLIYSENGYVFESSTNENLDPADIVAWAYVPPSPVTETEEDQG